MFSSKFSVVLPKFHKLGPFKSSLKFSTDANNKQYVVTILNASTKIGRNTSLLLKQCPMLDELRLFDRNSNVIAVAEDLSHIDTRTKVRSFTGVPVLKHAVTDADIVIALGGCKTKQNECPKTLFEKNLDDVRTAALHMIEFNSKGIFCLAMPPIEVFVPLVSEEYKKGGVYDSRKIIGVTSIASMRANYYISNITGQNATDVLCPIVGGISSNCLVAVISQSKPEKIHPQHYKILQDNIGNSENDCLKLYNESSTVCLSPALAISRFVNILLKALNGDTNCVDCAFVRQTGHIQQFLPYMASIVRFGRNGVLSCHMPKINGDEAFRLKKASLYIKELIKIGESFVTGESKPEKEAHRQHAQKPVPKVV